MGTPRAAARPANRRWSARGQALVEFALVVPVMLLLLLIAVDFGRLFFSYIAITNAAREGAAYAATAPTDAAGIARRAAEEANVQAQKGPGSLAVAVACSAPGGTTIDCESAAGGSGSGNTVTVTTSESFTFLTPFVENLFGDFSLGTSATAPVLGVAASGGSTPGNCATPPTANFTYSVSGLAVTVDASTSAPVTGLCAISGYNWDMGDGANPFPPIVGITPGKYAYAAAGTYPIVLTVTNQAGEATATISVTVGTPPPSPSPTLSPTPSPTPSRTPGPTASPPPVCNVAPTFTYQFTGNGNGAKKHQMTFYGAYSGQPAPASWTWTFGDGSVDSGQNSANDYSSSGTFTVTLKVVNGTCSKTTQQQVAVP